MNVNAPSISWTLHLALAYQPKAIATDLLLQQHAAQNNSKHATVHVTFNNFLKIFLTFLSQLHTEI